MRLVLIMVIDRRLKEVYVRYCFFLADVLDKLKDQIDETKLKIECKGGGRIRVDPATRTISVYGYSPVSHFLFC